MEQRKKMFRIEEDWLGCIIGLIILLMIALFM